jgi:hypothetical protein
MRPLCRCPEPMTARCVELVQQTGYNYRASAVSLEACSPCSWVNPDDACVLPVHSEHGGLRPEVAALA